MGTGIVARAATAMLAAAGAAAAAGAEITYQPGATQSYSATVSESIDLGADFFSDDWSFSEPSATSASFTESASHPDFSNRVDMTYQSVFAADRVEVSGDFLVDVENRSGTFHEGGHTIDGETSVTFTLTEGALVEWAFDVAPTGVGPSGTFADIQLSPQFAAPADVPAGWLTSQWDKHSTAIRYDSGWNSGRDAVSRQSKLLWMRAGGILPPAVLPRRTRGH